MKLEYIVEKNFNEMMLKEYIAEIGISKNLAKKIKLYGKMFINDIESKNYFLVKPNDKITLVYDEKMNAEINTIPKEIEILYEDENILVVCKERDLASQPSHRHQDDNLISYIKHYFIINKIDSNIHLVNRLDYSTSGVMIIAKNGYAHYLLTKNDSINVTRKYIAVVEGKLSLKEAKVVLKIERENQHSIKRIVTENGKLSITNYRVLKEYENESLVELKLDTGRTHQIRVTMAHLGHPVCGDKLYGTEGNGLMLHCYYLRFLNPFTNKWIEIKKMPNWDKYIKDIEKNL